MIRKSFDAFNINLDVLQPCTAKNNLLEVETTALRVTEKNIGHLAMYFGAEIWGSEGGYYILVPATRDPENFKDGHVGVTFRVGDWIVLLRGEIHKMDDKTFRHTFTTDEVIEFRCTVCGKISGDSEDGAYGEKHAAYTIAFLDGRPSHNVLEDCNMDEKV